MGTHLGYSLVADVKDPVTVLNRAEPVGNDDAGSATEHFPNAFLKELFRLGVNGRGLPGRDVHFRRRVGTFRRTVGQG